ncbi:MAG: hypothetical protein Q9M28_01090 [Mariprofundaceae bacterium]|nr:hypothetical protein [Mariprofundaceae bacterium]
MESAHAEVTHHLVQRGYARLINGLERIENFSYIPVNSAKDIANKVHEILWQRVTAKKS